MMYEGFANVYDHMMNHIPYETWFENLLQYLHEKGVLNGRICELGCGTGVMTEKFAAAGYDMIGLDKSVDMLAIAKQKQEESGSDILYLHQNMEEMELDGPVDAMLSVCDSVNYLLHEEEMNKLFSRVKTYVKPGGYFIFDLKTAYCYRNIIGNQTWVEQDEEVSYIWENYFYEDQDINEYMLTIFRKQADSELYERTEEAHYQRAYDMDTLKRLIEKNGLALVSFLDEDMKQMPNETSRAHLCNCTSMRRRDSMNRKVFYTILGMTILCGLVFFHSGNSLAANQTGIVTASSLNVRTGAGTSYDILQYNNANVLLAKEDKVTILEKLSGWYQVSFVKDNTTLTGFVSSNYIAIEQASTAVPAPTVTPASTSEPTITYRYETSYQPVSVGAKVLKKSKLYKANGKSVYKVGRKKMSLAKGKKIKVIGEKTLKGKKWFHVSFTYKKKKRKAYLQNKYVKLTAGKGIYAQIFNVKKAANIRKKKGTGSAYKKVGGKKVSIAKKAAVTIVSDVAVKSTRWYKLRFNYKGKTYTGYSNAKYVKLAKKPVTKKVAVVAMSDAQFEQAMKNEGFPESYKQSLRALHSAYPYWQFKAYKTGLDWNTAVTEESKTGVNLISNARAKAWKSTEKDAYDASTGKWKVFDGSTWVAASKAAVAYFMDPRNYLNDRSIYMFELLEYQSQYQTKSGVNTILSNTPFYNKKFSYTDVNTGAAKTICYVTHSWRQRRLCKARPYHLASRVKQEVVTSATTTSTAVTGTVSSYPGIYNFYNIGATSSSTPVLNGLKWASDKKAGTYLRPWTDPYRSIVGGAQYISSGYIAKGQNTCYLEKFNVTSYKRYSHQYMTNVEAAYEESIKTKKAYAGMMDKSPLVFSIPVYENMPAANSPMPK